MSVDLTGRRVRLTVGLFDGIEGTVVGPFVGGEWLIQHPGYPKPLPFATDEFEVIT